MVAYSFVNGPPICCKNVALRTVNWGLICHGLFIISFCILYAIIECSVCYCMACWHGIKTNDILLLQSRAF